MPPSCWYGTTINFTFGGVLDPAVISGDKRTLLLLIYVIAFCGFGVKAAGRNGALADGHARRPACGQACG